MNIFSRIYFFYTRRSKKQKIYIPSYIKEIPSIKHKIVKVPNVLMPFGVDNKKVYIYKNGKFELSI